MKTNCIGHGEVEVFERGIPTGISKIKLPSGAETTVPTSYLAPEPERPSEPEEAKDHAKPKHKH